MNKHTHTDHISKSHKKLSPLSRLFSKDKSCAFKGQLKIPINVNAETQAQPCPSLPSPIPTTYSWAARVCTNLHLLSLSYHHLSMKAIYSGSSIIAVHTTKLMLVHFTRGMIQLYQVKSCLAKPKGLCTVLYLR